MAATPSEPLPSASSGHDAGGIQEYRLYISSASPVSSRAVVNARRFLERHLPMIHRLSVLDIALHLASARADQIVASPTLIRLRPLPQRRFIGDMSNTDRLRAALGLPDVSDAVGHA